MAEMRALIRNPVDHLRVTGEGWEKTAAPDRIISGPSAPDIRSTIAHSLGGFRMIFELRPESLEQEGLVAALEKQAAALKARHGIEVETIFCAEPERKRSTV